MTVVSLRCFCASILLAVRCQSQGMDALESINWTCALPVEENTPLNDTIAGQWMIHEFFHAVVSATTDSEVLSEKVCGNWPQIDAGTCKQIVNLTLNKLVSQACSDFSPEKVYDICKETRPGSFCLVQHDPDNISQTCVMQDSKGVGISMNCPPGFYCRGSIYQPQACPKGLFCPHSAKRPLSCPDGRFCPVAAINVSCGEDSNYVKSSTFLKGSMCMPDEKGRTILPQPCPKGNYCQHGKNYSCGLGEYCPLGVQKGQKCSRLELCPSGSSRPNRVPKVLLFSVMFLAAAFILVYTVDFWCLKQDKRWLRVLLAVILLSIVWVAESVRDDPIYSPPFLLTGLFLCLLWGIIVTPLVWKCFNSMLARKTIDGVFFVSATLAAGYGCGDTATGVFVAMFFPGLWCFWASLVDEHSDGPSERTLLGMDKADRGKFRTMAIFSTVGIVMLGIMCDVKLVYIYVVLALIICIDIAIRIMFQNMLQICCKFEAQGARDDELGQTLADIEEPIPRPRDMSISSTPNNLNSSAQVDNVHQDRPGISIRFHHVTLEVPPKKAGEWKKIMNDITLSIPSGSSVAIMGPSGCGKSTLIKVLSGRANYGRISGSIIINEKDGLQVQEIQSLTGFVPQDDVMHRNLTVREVVKFQAALRMPKRAGDIRAQRIEGSVGTLINRLGLNRGEVENTEIGGDENKPGVSGGQRKRVSIAMELAAEPKLLLLDEPTSGLDSTTSEKVVEQITRYAKDQGCTSLAVIHQPRYSTLNLFDRVIFLSVGGYLVYSGKTGDCCKEYFTQSLSVYVPDEANPADTFLDKITPMEDENVEEKSRELAALWSQHRLTLPNRGAEPLETMRVEVPTSGETCTWGDAIFLQMQRAMLQMRRSSSQVAANNGLLVFSLLCLCVGAPPKLPQDDFMHPSLALFLLMLTQGVAAQRIFGGPEKVVGWREYGASINLVLYFVGRDLTAFIEMFVGSILFCMIYWPFGPLLISLHWMIWICFSFVYAVWGLNYVWSVLLDGGGAQMMAVVCSFVSFLFAGVQPQFVQLSQMAFAQGIYIMAVSPIRWAHGLFMCGHMLDATTAFSNELVQYTVIENLFDLGYPLDWVTENNWSCNNVDALTVKELWHGKMRSDFHGESITSRSFERPPIAFVCKPKQLLLLGSYFRIVAMVFLLATAKSNYTGGGPFLQSQNKLVAHFNRNVFRLMCVMFTNCMMAILIRTL